MKNKKELKMLVVDDDFFSRQLLKEILKPYGDVDTVMNGDETLMAFQAAHQKRNPYDLICLDLLMPVMNGLETLKRIRNLEEEKNIHGLDGVKVIIITGVDDNRSVFDTFNTGCEGYIRKPLDDENKLLKLMNDLGLI
jgi:two-component system chemotaxis response regulator CheY